MNTRKALVLSMILLGGLALGGCAVNIAGPSQSHHGEPNQENQSSKFSNSDVMFAQMMIPHHQQAVDMGTLAETRASDPEVQALAAMIKSEQAPEIEQMKKWLASSNAGEHMGHDMGMDGMLSADDFAALESATGTEFDRLFVAGMIAHHEGAVEMAKMVLNSENAEAKALGEAIVDSQTSQIASLKAILKRLG
jgi:uncharacterized protein (DUF305 family)